MNAADATTLALLAVLAFGGAFIFGITGFGAALSTMPLVTYLVPLPFALAMFSLPDCINACGARQDVSLCADRARRA